jgi:MFS transporter, DHA1 family, multidrug resistance protein
MIDRLRALDPALLLLAAMVFIVQVGVAIMLPLLPLYALSLGASPFVLGLLTSVFAVTNAIGQLMTGFLAERFPVRRLLAFGIGSYAIANFLIAGANTATSLVAFRGAAGIGGGVMLVGERLYLVQITQRARLAFANGVLSAAGSAGSVAGPALGGVLAALADLRLPFLIVGVTSLAATVGALFLPKPREDQPADVPPAATLTAEEDTSRTSDARRLVILLVAQLCLMSAYGAFITTYGPFADQRLGWSTAEVGLVFAVFGIGAIAFGPWLGRQADRRGRRLVAILSTLPIAVFAAVYWLEAPRLLLYASSLAAGAGITGVTASWYALLADATEGGRRGRRFGTVAALGNLGIIVGATLAAVLWESLGEVGIGFVIAGVSVVLCGLTFMLLPADRPPAGQSVGLSSA